jgi:putative pyruvate formate lyase activating enzyme
MLKLQGMGCHNINFVTPTHFTPQLIKAVKLASQLGLSVPIVWNCGGYESVEVIKLLDGIVDIYMPDFKYGDGDVALKYSKASNYFEVACKALKAMHDQVGDLVIEGGIATQGLLIRHLVLPNDLASSEKVLRFIAKELSLNSYVNIMAQYRPCYEAFGYKELARPITYKEYTRAIEIARDLGLHRGFRW